MLKRIGNRIDNLSPNAFSYLLTLPNILLFLVGGVLSVLFTFGLSFTNYKLNTRDPARFIGVDNYVKMFEDPIFLNSLKVTLYFTLISVAGTVVAGVILASILNAKFKGKKLFIAIFLIPWAIPRVSSGMMFKWMFDGDVGIVNILLRNVGLISGAKYWFSESPIVALNLVAFAEIWKNAPYVALLILAALQSIPASLYEAAKCDGANAVQRFWHITMPGIKYILVIIAMLQTMWSMKTFDLIYMMTGGGPGSSTTLTYMYVYDQAFSFLNMGYASALAYLLTIVIIIISVLYLKLLREKN